MKTVTTNQFAISVFYLVLATKLFTLLPNLFYYANNDAVFSMLFCFLIDFLIFLFVIILIKKNPETTFAQFLYNTFGSFFSRVIMIIFYVFISIKLCFLIGETYTFLIEFLYKELDLALFFIPCFFVCGYLAVMGDKTIARTMEFFVIPVAFGLLLTSLTATDTFVGDTLLPFFENGALPVFNSAKQSAFYFGNGLILLFFMGKVNTKQGFYTKCNVSLIVSYLFLIVLSVLFFEAYGQSACYVDFAIGDLPKYNPYVSDLGRLNWLNVVVCSVSLFLQCAFFLYGLNQLLKSILNTEKIIACTVFNCATVWLFAFIFTFSLSRMLEAINFAISEIFIYVIGFLLIICLIAHLKGAKKWKKQQHLKFSRG